MSPAPARRLGIRAYARHRGCAHRSVQKALERGRISAERDSRGRWSVDPQAADLAWARNTNERKRRPGSASGEAWGRAAEELLEAVRRKEVALADWHELRVQELESRLISAEELREAVAAANRAVRERLLPLAALLARELCPGDAARAEALLRRELEQALAELADPEALLPRCDR